MKKAVKVGRPRLPTRSTLISVRLHPPIIAALEEEADKRAENGPRPSTVAIIRWLVVEGLKERGHKLEPEL